MYNIYGIENSPEYNILYPLEKFEDIDNPIILHGKYRNINLNDKQLKVNFCEIKDGIIYKIQNGLKDEINNDCYYTYDIHFQYHDKIIKKPVKRDKKAKYSTIEKYLDVDLDSVYIKCEERKKIAFQLCQMIALTQNVELYSNSECVSSMPAIYDLIISGSRNNSLNILQAVLIECLKEDPL